MQQFIVSVYNNISDEDYKNLLDKELAFSKQLREKGILKKVFVKAQHRGAILIMQADSSEEIKALLPKFPFYPYWYKIEIDPMRAEL